MAEASYVAKVRERADTVTDADVEQLRADGFTEDEVFEQTVAVAIPQGLRCHDAAMDAGDPLGGYDLGSVLKRA